MDRDWDPVEDPPAPKLVTLLAASYIWDCPECMTENKLEKVPAKETEVKCENCGLKYRIASVEHRRDW